MSETSPKLRAELDGIPTYKPGKPAAAGGPVAYKLSSNENPYPPLPGVMESGSPRPRSFNRYPDMACTGLMNELADRFGVPVDAPRHRHRLGRRGAAAAPGHRRARATR